MLLTTTQGFPTWSEKSLLHLPVFLLLSFRFPTIAHLLCFLLSVFSSHILTPFLRLFLCPGRHSGIRPAPKPGITTGVQINQISCISLPNWYGIPCASDSYLTSFSCFWPCGPLVLALLFLTEVPMKGIPEATDGAELVWK